MKYNKLTQSAWRQCSIVMPVQAQDWSTVTVNKLIFSLLWATVNKTVISFYVNVTTPTTALWFVIQIVSFPKKIGLFLSHV